ncbi:MAG: dicarboxylate/amino acid:cation symporter [Verrucomicrobiales bacterium]|nr:dicarboxylate/amino acid:cation symporter [Verrucomicrobiales bacterium]|tara:strand:+ start:312 stop:1622 length:1311 start_codon:yes stop_codon:yes gene_type:complete
MSKAQPWHKQLHWRIIIGLILGLVYGVVAANMGWGKFTETWISPFGKIFMNLLKLIAVPLVLTSLVTGVASLSDTKKLSRMGGKTIGLYVGTTAIAVTIGLLIVNIMNPGKGIPDDLRKQLESAYASDVEARVEVADEVKQRSPIQPLVDMVPDNFFNSASSNRSMLQMVFVSLLLGIALIKIKPNKSKPVLAVFEGLMDTVIELVNMIMLLAPIGVFALLADTITGLAKDDPSQVMELLSGLGMYCITVVLGLFIHACIVYPTLFRVFTPMKLKRFFVGIAPAQLMAFSTSSSGATLPVTMDCAEKRLGVSDEVSSFVLPLGATINMDGTALYQAVAAVFIAQVVGIELTIANQLTIVLTAVLASIGTAAVPGAGIIMLVIILEAVGVPSAGIALILGVDRILDMLRTVCNVTGDATVATVIASSEGQLGESKEA